MKYILMKLLKLLWSGICIALIVAVFIAVMLVRICIALIVAVFIAVMLVLHELNVALFS